MKSIDLNCDMGELPELIADGTQEALMASITSVNIACGGHAGDESTMETTILQALRHGLAVGAHPGYSDRANFGRIESHLPTSDIAALVYAQVDEFARIAAKCGAAVTHVKAHGALYNQAVKSAAIAGAIAAGVARCRRDVVLVGLAGSLMLQVFRSAGFAVAAEAFADRRYEPDGTLRSRKLEGALIEDAEAAAAQALNMVAQGKVIASDGSSVPIEAQTICIHGDTPGSVRIAASVASKLRAAGVELCSLHRNSQTPLTESGRYEPSSPARNR